MIRDPVQYNNETDRDHQSQWTHINEPPEERDHHNRENGSNEPIPPPVKSDSDRESHAVSFTGSTDREDMPASAWSKISAVLSDA